MILTYKERLAIVEKYVDEIEEAIMEGLETEEMPVDPAILMMQAFETLELKIMERLHLRSNN